MGMMHCQAQARQRAGAQGAEQLLRCACLSFVERPSQDHLRRRDLVRLGGGFHHGRVQHGVAVVAGAPPLQPQRAVRLEHHAMLRAHPLQLPVLRRNCAGVRLGAQRRGVARHAPG